jgi:hypothetical protein
MAEDNEPDQPNLPSQQAAEDHQASRVLPAGPRRTSPRGKQLPEAEEVRRAPLTAERRL